MPDMDISTQDVRVMQRFIDTLVGTEKFSYPAKRNAPKPSGEFAHIQRLEEYQVGIPNLVVQSQTDTTTTHVIISPSRLRFRIGIVETAGMASIKIMHGWTKEAVKALMIETGYGFIKCEPIGIEDAKQEKHWEVRQSLSIEMYVTRYLQEEVDNITGMTITGEYIKGDYLQQLLIDVNN
jgi:hypothetical protein